MRLLLFSLMAPTETAFKN